MKDLKPISYKDFINLKHKEREYVLKPILPVGGLMEIFSKSGYGKTTLSLSFAMAISSGSSFLKWDVPKSRKTLYVDGEMSAYEMKERMEGAYRQFSQEDNYNFDILSAELMRNTLPDIATIEGQKKFTSIIQEYDVVVMDNMSCLVWSGNENDAESWTSIQRWLIQLRSLGKTVIMLHHAGKSGTSRGSSKRHGVLDTVIKLDRPVDYKNEEGLKIQLSYEKCRSFIGKDASTIGLEYKLVDGIAEWKAFNIVDEKLRDIVEFDKKGLSQLKIAEQLNLSQGEVSKRLKKAKDEGLV
tara:strand:+ start:5562 stop:6455 length:894 start_codon:yes stop_codon:yes gene_type:complete